MAAEPDPSFFLAPPQAPVEERVDEEDFAPEVADDVQGLLHLGKLSKSFEVFGHRIVLKTLTMEEELAVGQIIDEYGGSFFQGKAATAAYVAAGLVTVDGEEVTRALQNDPVARVRAKFNYITRWDPVVVDAIYAALQELFARKIKAYEEVQGKSSASPATSTS